MNSVLSKIKSVIERRGMLLVIAFVVLCWWHVAYYLDPVVVVVAVLISGFSLLGFVSYRLVNFFSTWKNHTNAKRQG
ncbi:hypothetical protein [Acidithiobacillus concretivorus]|uniref:Uncharacterized protein n=1 Tax=Acidithiobacillus concretivorus TaxID=3063952 RepID=A0ABS5ZR60_9PROT|nr:hypothetical protein [Acidithiobacillus concretivorus]MBU2739108.1 hypothetical protein [Acidithiobacillus concretivorus]